MADIKLDIDVSSIAKAKKALKDFSNQSDKLGRSVMAAGKKVQSVSSGWAEANKMYKQGVLNSKQLSQAQVELARELAVINGYTKKNGSLNTDRALRELKAAEAAKDNARATQEAADAARKQAREIDRLKGKFVANYGASQKYKKEIRDLIRAKRQGIVTTDQYGDAVQRLKSDFRDVQNGVARGSNQFASYNTATYRANQQTKRFASVGLQQAGYQVGDFAVQLQGGTNAAVAFGQQGSQLLGIFGAWGAVGGAALAIATAFAAPLLDMAEASDKAAQSLKKFKDATKSAKESISDMRFELEALNAGFEDLEKFALDKAMREAQAEVARTEATVERLKQAVEDSDTITSGRGADRLPILRAQLALEQASLEAAKEELEEYTRLKNALKEGNNQLRQQVSHLAQIATIQEEVNAGVQSILSNRDAELQKQRDRIALARAAIQYGEDSVQYSLKQQEIEERILRGKLEEENIRGNIADEIVRAWREANTLEDAADSINSKLARMERLASSVTFHMMQGSEGAQMLEKYGGRGGRGSSDREPIFGDTGDSIYSDPTGSGGGASGPTQAEVFNRSSESLTNLIAKYDEGVAEAKKLRDAQVTVNDAVANGVITQQQGTQVMQDFIASLDQAEGPLQKIGNTMKDAFGNALMSIVDGTKSAKDAFKDMARAVLKQAYELLVIKPLMNSLFGQSGGGGIVGSFLSGLTGQANGGAWNNGVQMYANGGVVGSPTAFQHKGGLGVMGEAGPEAIMPLKRGKNGKLGVQSEGGSGDVNVTQVFNINGNGDEYILQKIKQQAPKIASYTQQQILDQRRRGGAMKSTFGG